MVLEHVDQQFIKYLSLNNLYKKYENSKRQSMVFFISFEKAYESIHREKLINIFVEFHFPHKFMTIRSPMTSRSNVMWSSFVIVRSSTTSRDPIGQRDVDLMSHTHIDISHVRAEYKNNDNNE